MTGVFDTFPCGHPEKTWMETPQIIHLPFVKSNARVMQEKWQTRLMHWMQRLGVQLECIHFLMALAPIPWFLITLWCFDTCINLRTNQWSHLCLIHRLLDAQIMFWSGVLPLADASFWTSHQYTGGWFLITSIHSLILLWHKLQFTSLVFFKQLYHDAEWISVIMIQFRFLNSVHSVISYASPLNSADLIRGANRHQICSFF